MSCDPNESLLQSLTRRSQFAAELIKPESKDKAANLAGLARRFFHRRSILPSVEYKARVEEPTSSSLDPPQDKVLNVSSLSSMSMLCCNDH